MLRYISKPFKRYVFAKANKISDNAAKASLRKYTLKHIRKKKTKRKQKTKNKKRIL